MGEWVGGWVSEWVSELVSEWVSEWAIEWVSDIYLTLAKYTNSVYQMWVINFSKPTYTGILKQCNDTKT